MPAISSHWRSGKNALGAAGVGLHVRASASGESSDQANRTIGGKWLDTRERHPRSRSKLHLGPAVTIRHTRHSETCRTGDCDDDRTANDLATTLDVGARVGDREDSILARHLADRARRLRTSETRIASAIVDNRRYPRRPGKRKRARRSAGFITVRFESVAN